MTILKKMTDFLEVLDTKNTDSVHTRVLKNSRQPAKLSLKMTQNNMNVLFDAFPTDLQDKVCENIVYEQQTVLMNEIKTALFANNFYEIQKVFVDNPKKMSGLTDTLALMRKHGAVKQAEVFEKIIQEILEKQETK